MQAPCCWNLCSLNTGWTLRFSCEISWVLSVKYWLNLLLSAQLFENPVRAKQNLSVGWICLEDSPPPAPSHTSSSLWNRIYNLYVIVYQNFLKKKKDLPSENRILNDYLVKCGFLSWFSPHREKWGTDTSNFLRIKPWMLNCTLWVKLLALLAMCGSSSWTMRELIIFKLKKGGVLEL